MTVTPAPPVPDVSALLRLGDHTVDLATRALVVGVVPLPRFGREAEVAAGVRAAAAAGADIVEVPAEPRLLGPAARVAGDLPVAAQVTTPAAAGAAWSAGARLLLVPADHRAAVEAGLSAGAVAGADADWQVAVLVTTAEAGRDQVSDGAGLVAIDTSPLDRVDGVSEESLALSVGVRLVRTADIRRTRRVVEVMAHLLEARR
jgi:hypothetical protein